VEFYSSSVSKELKGEEEMGLRRFSGGSESGMTSLRFGSLRAEEGGSRQCTARWCGRRGSGANGSRRWEPMEAGGGSQWKPEVGADALVGRTGPKGRAEQAGFGGSEGEMKMGRVMKWAKSQGGCNINSFFLFEC
jgi:hypothetical protein